MPDLVDSIGVLSCQQGAQHVHVVAVHRAVLRRKHRQRENPSSKESEQQAKEESRRFAARRGCGEHTLKHLLVLSSQPDQRATNRMPQRGGEDRPGDGLPSPRRPGALLRTSPRPPFQSSAIEVRLTSMEMRSSGVSSPWMQATDVSLRSYLAPSGSPPLCFLHNA